MAIPKYQYIKDELKQKIISGQFENGDKFYTEAELIQMYDVSSITVVRALNDLANDGYIIRQQLGLKSNQFYYRIERVRETNGVTYIYQQSYIPEQYVNANYPNLEYYSSIYGRFKADYHIHMNDEPFEEINEIIFPTPKHVAEKLGIDPQFPSVHQVKTTQLESTGQILEYVESYKRGDFYKIKFIASDKSR